MSKAYKCDGYSNYVVDNRLCHNCMYRGWESCAGCVAYSKYESWTDCVNLSKENNKKEVNDD